MGFNGDEEAQEETASRRTESERRDGTNIGTGANEHVPTSAAHKRHQGNDLHEQKQRIAELEARLHCLQVSNVENFVCC